MADAPTPQEVPKPSRRRLFWPGGLSARLLTLTILFVAAGGMMALPPALAAYQESWLLDRVRAAETISRISDIAPERMTLRQREQLLQGAGVEWVAISTPDVGLRLVLQGARRPERPYLVDLREQGPGSWLVGPFNTLFGGDGRYVRVRAKPRFIQADYVEVVAPDAELKQELWGYLWRVVIIVAFVSTLAGVLVYLSLNLFLVRPMQKITYAIERFRADPDDPEAKIELSGRRDEIGRAEAELERMQADLRAALNSRARLAALGEAVAKINHDLRNMLTSAQIASERLAALKDPKVSQALPRLERALDRAVKLASDVLAYGKTQEAAPETRAVRLADAVEAAAEEARLSDQGVRLALEVGRADQVIADPDQLHRILANLLRNAREAIEHQAGRTGPGRIRVSLEQTETTSLVRIADNGPGVPERVRDRLFLPFSGSARPEGAGLGLAIARELAQGHGGDVALIETGVAGSTFELRLPGAPPKASARRPRSPGQ
jgi:signal transduction histidine kinase